MKLSRVLIDVATQRDFLADAGSLPVRNRAALLPRIRRVMAWARVSRIPVISALESHRDTDSHNGRPRFCLDDTWGQQKLAYTLLASHTLLEVDNTFHVPRDVFRRYRQVILRKRTEDFFSNPKADRLLTELQAGEFYLFGVGLESGVKLVALGLRARGKAVTLIRDACGYWNTDAAEMALRQLDAKGVRLITADELPVLWGRRMLVGTVGPGRLGAGRRGTRTAADHTGDRVADVGVPLPPAAPLEDPRLALE